MAGNPLFNILGGGRSAMPFNIQNLLTQFQQFKQTFQGDPRQQIQGLLDSGKVSQEQYNNAVQIAKELQKFLH